MSHLQTELCTRVSVKMRGQKYECYTQNNRINSKLSLTYHLNVRIIYRETLEILIKYSLCCQSDFQNRDQNNFTV